MAHSQDELRKWGVLSVAKVREVVVTLTVWLEREVALTVTLDGREQVAPVGAPLQTNVMVPAIPAPPRVSV
jgi:hypothetical protein